MTYTTRELRAKIASNDYGAELCLQSAMANIEALEKEVAALLRSDRRSATNGMRNAMGPMRAVFVEFIQKAPGVVTKDDEFLSVKCDTVAQAIEVEALFHGAGWTARVVEVESVRSFPTAGMRTNAPMNHDTGPLLGLGSSEELGLPAVARLYYTGVGHRRYKRASTQSGPGEPLCFVSLAMGALKRQAAQHAAARDIGAQLANVAFNLAQRPGHVLTSDDVALLDKLRLQWDAQ